MKPLSFIIIGSGWRSLFFARIAKQFPEQFSLKYMLCRTPEKAQMMAEEYGVPTTTSEEECDLAKPDFVVIAVSRNSIFTETKKWSDKGYPILAETPAGVSVEELKNIWEMVQKGAKIQIAEQYHRYPLMAAGLKAVAEGKLGEPHMAHLSLAHEYHGVSLIRRMLQPEDPMSLQLEYITGMIYKHQVTETDSRYGAITDGSIKERDRAVFTLQFTNGKVAYYDFSGVQYHSFIRTRHLNVKGPKGEWNDTMLRYVVAEQLPENANLEQQVSEPMEENISATYTPVAEELTTYLSPQYAPLETEALRKQSRQWNPFIEMDNGQDEYAIGSMMFDMREYIAGGAEVYPIAESLEDAYITLLMLQAAQHPGEHIVPEHMPWQE